MEGHSFSDSADLDWPFRPPAVKLDFGFAEYHSKVEVEGNVLRYTRDLKLKEVLVTKKSFDDLKKFYRVITADERNAAVLARVTP